MPAPDRPRRPPARALLLRLATALAAGQLLAWAFPTYDHWWLAPVAVALLSVAVLGTTARVAAVLGLAAGLTFFLPTLSWAGTYVGNLPWIALSALQALYLAVMAAATVALQRPFLAAARAGVRPLAYAVVPVLWVLQETARSHTPFGGFPWARLAFSQADSPLAGLAAYAGAPGVTAAVAALGALLHAGGTVLWSRTRRHPRPVTGRAAYPLLAAGLALLAVLPAAASLALRAPVDGEPADVLLVQGNVPEPGLDFNAERRAVLDNHVRTTLGAPGLEGSPPSVVVWPENASDIDPTRNPDAEAAIRSAVEGSGAPVLVGAVLSEPDPMISNVSLLYRPGGGTPERYVKQHPVPFAEYIPFRSFFRNFSDKVDLVTRDFTAGDSPGGFEIERAGAAPYWLIPTICFEVAYDDLMREATLQPGRRSNILAVQTNNATFGYTAESEQQFAISRLRAIEHGRAVVHVSTVGVSGFINPDGTFERKTALFTAAAERGSPVVRDAVTVSNRIGDTPEYAAGGLALLLAVAGRWRRLRPARVEARTPRKEEALRV